MAYRSFLSAQLRHIESTVVHGSVHSRLTCDGSVVLCEKMRGLAERGCSGLYKDPLRHAYLKDLALGGLAARLRRLLPMEALVVAVDDDDREAFEGMVTQTAGKRVHPRKLWNEMKGTHDAMSYLSLYDEVGCQPAICMPLAKELNILVGYTTGHPTRFRTSNLVPNDHCSTVYDPTVLIEGHLNELLVFCSNEASDISKIEDFDAALLRVHSLGAVFFSNFILIRPFEDGNEPVARLLLSLLMKPYTTVPTSLYTRIHGAQCVLAARESADGWTLDTMRQYIMSSSIVTATLASRLYKE